MAKKLLKVGIMPYRDMKVRTIAIARGRYKPSPGEPKVWFTSLRSLASVLSEEN
jgi:predicted transcriptional regulator